MYVCAAPFLAQRLPPGATVPEPQPLSSSWLDRWTAEDGIAIFLDLPPIPVLSATAEFARRGFYVVPVIQRWPRPSSALPTAELLHALVEFSRAARPPQSPRGVVFILDGERGGPLSGGQPGIPPDPRRFDNRYHYSADRFPAPALLAERGIGKVEWAAPQSIAADLQPYALSLAEQGLRPVAVDTTAS
jgi:hypothetical protein